MFHPSGSLVSILYTFSASSLVANVPIFCGEAKTLQEEWSVTVE